MKWPRLLMLGGYTGLATVFLPATAAGHGLNAKVFLSEPAVTVEAQYSDASPASHATVKVYGEHSGGASPDPPLLLEAKLDSEGKYAFVPQAAQDLSIVIDDNAGHRAEVHVLAKSLRILFDKGGDRDFVPTSDPIGVSPGPLLLEGAPLWGKVLIGVGVILCLGFVLRCVLRLRKTS